MIHYNQQNTGFAAAQNQAIALSRGEWILTLNPDVLLMPTFIEELVLASLSRFPTQGELEFAKHLIEEKGRSQGLGTMQWVMLNTPEFLLNH